MKQRCLQTILLLLTMLLMWNSLPAMADYIDEAIYSNEIRCQEKFFIDKCRFAELHTNLLFASNAQYLDGLIINFSYDLVLAGWLGNLANTDAMLSVRWEKLYSPMTPSQMECLTSYMLAMLPVLNDFYSQQIRSLENIKARADKYQPGFYDAFLTPELAALKSESNSNFISFLKLYINAYTDFNNILDEALTKAESQAQMYGLDKYALAQLADLKKMLFTDAQYVNARVLQNKANIWLARLIDTGGELNFIRQFIRQRLFLLTSGVKLYCVARNWQHYQLATYPAACDKDYFSIMACIYLSDINSGFSLKGHDFLVSEFISLYPQAHSYAELNAYRATFENYCQMLWDLVHDEK